MQRESRTVMRNPAPDTRENVARTTGVQDHEAGFFEKLIFWRTKRRYGHVLLSTAFAPTQLLSAVRAD